MNTRAALVLSLLLGLVALSATPPLDVPFVRQEKAGCGSAAIAMVVQYWALQVPALAHAAIDTEQINRMLPPASAKGIRGQALRQYLENAGFSAFVISAEKSDLAHHLASGRPVVVAFAPRGPRSPLHYAVVVGLDQTSVWLNDPARGKLTRDDLDGFLQGWKVTGNWALLAVPREIP